MLCDYGCGRIAVHQFKSGKWGCSTSPNHCPQKRQYNSVAIKALRKDKGDNYWHEGVPFGMGVPTGRKGKTYIDLYGEERAKDIAKRISNSHIGAPCYAQTTEGKAHLSTKAKERGFGGYVPKSGRGRKGEYKGIWCDSSWELAFVIYSLDHHKSIQRVNEYRLYHWEGQTRRYYPDFVVDGQIVEIKGYDSPQWDAKLKANPDIVVLYENDMREIIEYVVRTYGKNYIYLYER